MPAEFLQISSKGVEQIRRSRVLQKSVPEFHGGVVQIGAHHLCKLEQGDFNLEFNFCKFHISSNNQQAMHILTSWGLIYIISIFANLGNNVNWGTSNSCMQLLYWRPSIFLTSFKPHFTTLSPLARHEYYRGRVYLNLELSFQEYIFLRRAGVSGNSRSRPFPRMKASDSLSRIMGMDFFIPFPFPNFGNAFCSFPSHSRIFGMIFFIPCLFPN